MGALAIALLASACLNVEIPLFSGGGELQERVLRGERGPKILLVDLSGTLGLRAPGRLLGLPGGESPVARLREELDRARRDDEIAALVLRIDSPGGTVIASEILHGEVERWKRETGRPVVAHLMGVAASGGYYVAMAADRVQAYPATITGSIGVIMLGFNASGLMEKVGVGYQTFTSGAFKDAGSPFRPMNEAERGQLSSVVRDLFAGFLDVVARGRPKLTSAEIERLADGRIYSAKQALESGLIDGIGDLEQTIGLAEQAAGVEGDARLVVYRRPGERWENLFSAASASLTAESAAAQLSGALAESSFLYWWPGAANGSVLLEALSGQPPVAAPGAGSTRQ
ncbi:MAG TPA: signal peptide peptidase SppA [Myxococcota bacterium]|nr:signal peptide peptidase SppA [Myxococcota bacterium]